MDSYGVEDMSYFKAMYAAFAMALAVPAVSHAAPDQKFSVKGVFSDTVVIRVIDTGSKGNDRVDVNSVLSQAGYDHFSKSRDGVLYADFNISKLAQNGSADITSVNTIPVGKEVPFAYEHSGSYIISEVLEGEKVEPHPREYKEGIRGFMMVGKTGHDLNVSLKTTSVSLSRLSDVTTIKDTDVSIPNVTTAEGDFRFTHLKDGQNTAVVPGI